MNSTVRKLPKIVEKISDLVDRLGRTKAEIADLEVQEKKDVTALKSRGVGEYVGTLFQAQIFEQERGKSTNWEALVKELKARAALIAKHTVTQTVSTTNWEAIAQELQPDPKLIEKHTTVAQTVTVCKVTARK